MILTTGILKEQLSNYANPAGKIGRMVKNGELIPLTKGLYENNPKVSGLYLANAIYGLSYLSFNTALSYHGLIPEAVYVFSSATCDKKKKKSYSNYFGSFTYRDVPTEVFRYGIKIVEENGYSFMIATPEKALCDKLYEIPPVKNQKGLEDVLFSGMRLDHALFDKLNRADIYFIAPKYHSNNVTLLEKYLRRKYHE